MSHRRRSRRLSFSNHVQDRPLRRKTRPHLLRFELLEDRRVLSGASPQIDLFSASPALHGEDQGWWADESVRYAHQDNETAGNAHVGLIDSGEGETASSDVVRYRLALTDLSGNPLANNAVGVGETFQVRGYVRDVRGPDGSMDFGQPTGVYAAYMNVSMTNAHLATIRYGETQELRMDATRPGDVWGGFGTFTLTFSGQTTEPIMYLADRTADAAAIQSALEQLSSIGPGNVEVTTLQGDNFLGRYFVRFVRGLGEQDVPGMTVHSNGLVGTGFNPAPQVADNYIPVHPSTPELEAALFKSSFTFYDPYTNGPSAVDERSESGTPDDSRQWGDVGAFLNRFSLQAPGYGATREYLFFSVDMRADQEGTLSFSGNPAEIKTLVFSIAGDGSDINVHPENLGFTDPAPLTIRDVPWIASLSAAPDLVIRPGEITLTAHDVPEADRTLARVAFYRDTNGNGVWDEGEDQLLGVDEDGSNGWSLTVPTTDWSPGTQTFYARAQDIGGAWSPTVSATATVQNAPPAVSSLTADPDPVTRPGLLTLHAVGVTDPDGTVTQVGFYRGNELLGTDMDGSDGWSLAVPTAGWDLGTHTFSARARDNDGAWGAMASTTATVKSAGIAVRYRLALTDQGGNPLVNHTVSVGETFQVRGYVQDMRGQPGGSVELGQPTGVFSAYLDVLMTNADLATIRHGETQELRMDATRPADVWGGLGTLTLTFLDQTTEPIPYLGSSHEDAAAIQAALEALPSIGPGNVEVTTLQGEDFHGRYFIRFVRGLGEQDVPGMTVHGNGLIGTGFDPAPQVTDDDIPIHPATPELEAALFKSSFTFFDPYLNGPGAVEKPPEPGTPDGSFQWGEVGGFLNRFSLQAPGYGATNEYLLFSVDVRADRDGTIQFSGTPAEVNKTLVFSLPGGGSSNIQVDPDNIAFLDPAPLTILEVPWIGSLSAAPDPVIRPDEITLTAHDVGHPNRLVARIAFYRDTNGDGVWNEGDDDLLGMDEDGSNGWSLSVPTAGWSPGTQTFYARAQDNHGVWSETVRTTATVHNAPPLVSHLTADPDPVTQPGSLTLTAMGVRDPDGTVLRVEFYRDDVLLGTDEDGSDGWSWTGGAEGWPVGEFTFQARAQDDDGAWSESASVRATVASWQNPANPLDVNGDGKVEPVDVLMLINKINRDGAGVLPPRTADDLHLPYFDVAGDGSVTPLDVLVLINHINLYGTGAPAADAESAPPPGVFAVVVDGAGPAGAELPIWSPGIRADTRPGSSERRDVWPAERQTGHAVDHAFAQLGDDRAANTIRRSERAGRWTPLEDLLTLLASPDEIGSDIREG